MNFKGDGYVELRPPKDLDDLKAYTSLSLKLQRPLGRGDGRRRRRQAVKDEDMFVMYLGNRDVSESIKTETLSIFFFFSQQIPNKLFCVAVLQELHRYGSEEKHFVHRVQTQQCRI